MRTKANDWTHLASWGLVLASLWTPAVAQDGDGMEEFEEVDPYTEGEKERMALLGYTTFGPFQWKGGDSTTLVQQNLGDMPMLFVETEHFRIASSLTSYTIPNDKEEKDRIKDELKALKKKLGNKFKPPKKKLDPWLRLHLYAQRAEALYDQFLEDFGLTEKHFEDLGPNLGSNGKFYLLLCQRKSEYSRHMKTYCDIEIEEHYRWNWDDSFGFGANMEVLKARFIGVEDPMPFDSILYCEMASSLAMNFANAYRRNFWGAPFWLSTGLSHVYTRRIDPRWVTAFGLRPGQVTQEDDYEWESRVANLVKNEFWVTTAQMFEWLEYGELNVRDHMIAWSRLDFLLSEIEGDHAGFLRAVCVLRPNGDADTRKKAMSERCTPAFAQAYGMTPRRVRRALGEVGQAALQVTSSL